MTRGARGGAVPVGRGRGLDCPLLIAKLTAESAARCMGAWGAWAHGRMSVWFGLDHTVKARESLCQHVTIPIQLQCGSACTLLAYHVKSQHVKSTGVNLMQANCTVGCMYWY